MLLSLMAIGQILTAQNLYKTSIDGGGELFNNNEIHLLFTLGEVFVSERTGGNLTISEGFISKLPESFTTSQNIVEEQQIAVFPNPASSYFSVESGLQIERIILYNINGAKVKETNKTENIMIDFLPEGIYTLLIFAGEKVFTERMVVVR